jgi:hypothetical protein
MKNKLINTITKFISKIFNVEKFSLAIDAVKNFYEKAKIGQHVQIHAKFKVECKICHAKVKLRCFSDHIRWFTIFSSIQAKQNYLSAKLVRIFLKILKFVCQFCNPKFVLKSLLNHHM